MQFTFETFHGNDSYTIEVTAYGDFEELAETFEVIDCEVYTFNDETLHPNNLKTIKELVLDTPEMKADFEKALEAEIEKES